MTRRGQITIPDVVYFGTSLLILAGLAPAIYMLLDDRAADLGAGFAFLAQMVVPGLVVTMLLVLFAIAVGGR